VKTEKKAAKDPKKDGETKEGDEKIEAAAEEAEEHEEPDGDEGKMIGKSFKLKLDDGTEVDAVDGAELFKSLTARVEKAEADAATREAAITGALRQVVDIAKSLADQVKTLSESGRGRKAVVSISEKPVPKTDIEKSEPAGVEPGEFLAKALDMQSKGLNGITGRDVQRAEAHLNMNLPVPADIVVKVLGSK
jgi:hypothetical protein